MGVPFSQQARVGAYVVKQHLKGVKRYPLVLMLEPLFRCNLACAGCGKIDYPSEILNKRISIEDAINAAEECGAPVVSIAGGEPLIHKEIDQIVVELIRMFRNGLSASPANSSASSRTAWSRRSWNSGRRASSMWK